MGTAVEWFNDEILIHLNFDQRLYLKDIFEQAKELGSYNAKVEAKKYYLKGFEDAELTENQGCSHEQTMRDAETQFELVYPIKSE
jgi:hypothetical protein